MELKNKLSLSYLPYLILAISVQSLGLYLFLDAAVTTSGFSTLTFVLLSALSTSLILISLLLLFRFNIGRYFQVIFNYINEFIVDVCDGKEPNTEQPAIKVDEMKSLMQCLNFMQRKVNIHQKSMEKLAYYDSLTGLPNKDFLKQELKRMLNSAKRNNKHLAVMYLDIDEFKVVNDTLGHDIGDMLLTEASKRMQNLLRGSDYINSKKLSQAEEEKSLLARLAGDEFTLLLSDIDDPSSVSIVAKRVLEGMAMSFKLKQHEVQVSASIGIAVYPEDGTDTDTLLKNADFAMFEAKKRGKSTFEFYTKELNEIASRKMAMVKNIRQALDKNEFLIFFHPRINLKNQKVVGFEALIRWQSPELGFVLPSKFLPLAEETILICEIGNWVFDKVCQYIKYWVENGQPDIRVSINLSKMQIYRGDTYNLIKTYLNLYGISGKNLEIEVTEGGVLKDEDAAIELLIKLKALGITISLDDFGTGYSSLRFLQSLPIDVLKIDRGFISEDSHNDSGKQLLKSVIDIAHNFSLLTVASGLEKQHQIDFVKSISCDYVQGYFYSKPIAGDDILQFMLDWQTKNAVVRH